MKLFNGRINTSIIAQLVLGVLASMIVMWFSRQREFRADSGGATLARRDKMIAALQRLGSLHPQPPPDQMAAFGIAGELDRGLNVSLPRTRRLMSVLRRCGRAASDLMSGIA